MPRVTLVVAMRNEERGIAACLTSLEQQDYPEHLLEVLVYDGRSKDGSWTIAASHLDRRPHWRLLDNPARIQAAAWNAGIRAAAGDIVGIVSGHATLAPSYVRRLVTALEETGADMVGGPVHPVGVGTIGRAVARAMSTPFGVGGARHHYLTERGEVDTVFMGACRRPTYLRHPFDEGMVRNQDDELSYRLIDAGGRIVCDPAIESTYVNRSSMTGLWRQFHDYGLWKIPVLIRHPRRARLRHLAPAGLVAGVAGSAAVGGLFRPARPVAPLLAGMYLVAASMAAARYSHDEPRTSSPALVAVFATMHAAYGTGMLMGVARLIRGDWRIERRDVPAVTAVTLHVEGARPREQDAP